MKNSHFVFIGVLVAFCLGSCGGSSSSKSSATDDLSLPQTSDNSAIEPELRSSENGLLDATLTVAFTTLSVDDISVTTRTYDGSIPGPTLKVRPGDTLKMRIVNALPANSDADMDVHTMNMPHHPNTTNIHTHGLHVSPAGNSDNVLIEIAPGQTFEYEFKIPADHPAGTFWYHPHKHGAASEQVWGGMTGALIVEGDIDAVAEIAAAEEVVLLINELCLDEAGTVADFETAFFNNEARRLYSVNGRLNPTIKMHPGEVQRWRFINGAARASMQLQLDSHTWHQIAVDGLTFLVPEESDTFLMAPGNRADVLVQAGAAGTYQLKKLALEEINGMMSSAEEVLATVVVEGDSLSMSLPSQLPAAALRAIGDDDIVTTRQLTFDMAAPNRDSAPYPRFMINNKQFDSTRVDQTMRLNTAEEWTVTNTTLESHPFHMHTNPFLVTQVNGVAVAAPFWRDTLRIEAGGSLTFRARFSDFIGQSAVHCHMLEHEDLGMMSLVEVAQ